MGRIPEDQDKLRDMFFRKYRTLRASCDEAILEREREAEDYVESFDWFVCFMIGKDPDALIRELEATSAHTEAIICRIDKALEIYQQQVKHEDLRSWRQYDAMYSIYFSSQKVCVKDLARKYGVKKSTVYVDVKTAKTRLNGLLFGDSAPSEDDSEIPLEMEIPETGNMT